MPPIDLRSDTVTRPTPEMRRAMAEAEVGDDVFGDDPTVNGLQEQAADMLGKEAGLFVPTGSMGNQVCLGALTSPGDEIVCESGAHYLHYEAGSIAAHLGLIARPLSGERGVVSAEQVSDAIRPGDDHSPRTAVVGIENTHNSAGGTVFPIDEARAVAKVCRERDVAVHIDGARIFNAQAATGIPAREWAACADTITFCFSKGLGAPVGSLTLGTADVIAEMRVWRKRMGGGMRQVGVLAAAGLHALDHHVERLADDHAHARLLAEACGVDPTTVDTNIVVLPRTDAPEYVARAADAGVRVAMVGPTTVRLVTHLDVTREDAEKAAAALAAL